MKAKVLEMVKEKGIASFDEIKAFVFGSKKYVWDDPTLDLINEMLYLKMLDGKMVEVKNGEEWLMFIPFC